MKAKYFKTEEGKKKYDIVAINVDQYSLTHLKQGLPLRVAFYTDDNEGAPWYDRECMVIEIGLNINLDEKEQSWKERVCEKGLVDKSYLLTSAAEIKQSLLRIISDELKFIGVESRENESSLNAKKDSSNVIAAGIPETKSHTGNRPEQLTEKEAAEMLGISKTSFNKLVKKELVPGEYVRGIGWFFVKSDIEKFLAQEPDFLRKIWECPHSLKKKNEVDSSSEIILMDSVSAAKILSVEEDVLIELAKEKEVPAEYSEVLGQWFFDRAEIEKLLIDKPAFMPKVKKFVLTR